MAAILAKTAAGARFFLSPETWRVALGEARRGPGPPAGPPAVVPLEEDRDAGLRRVAVAGRGYWVPMATDWEALAEIHREVFDPAHPHHYEFGGCRVRPGDVVLDAGASEGFFVRFALDRGARVLAVEPWGPMAEALRRTFAAEAADGRFAVAEEALADRSGEATLRLDPTAPWGARLDDEGPTARPGEAVATVPRTTLDALIDRSPWGRCDFLKMDIEGGERPAVAGARATLRRDRPCLAIAVYHRPTGYLDIRRDLLGAGLAYRVTAKGLQRRRGGFYVPMVLHAWPSDRGPGGPP